MEFHSIPFAPGDLPIPAENPAGEFTSGGSVDSSTPQRRAIALTTRGRLKRGSDVERDLTTTAASLNMLGLYDERDNAQVQTLLKNLGRSSGEALVRAIAAAEKAISSFKKRLIAEQQVNPVSESAVTLPHDRTAFPQTPLVALSPDSPTRTTAARVGVGLRPLLSLPAVGQIDLFASATDVPGLVGKQIYFQRGETESVLRLAHDEGQSDALDLRTRIARLREQGKTVAEIMTLLELPASKRRFVERITKRAREGKPVHDLRRTRAVKPNVMLAPVEHEILALLSKKRGATTKAIYKELLKRLTQVNEERRNQALLPLPLPSESTLRRFIQTLPKAVTASRGSLVEFNKQVRLTSAADLGRYPNDVWEIDALELNFWITENVDGVRSESRPWAIVVLDTYSRAVVSTAIRFGSIKAQDTLRALSRVMLAEPSETRPFAGLPREIRWDRGSEFKAESVARLLRALMIHNELLPPRAPNTRPHIERINGTLERACSALPGYVPTERGIENRQQVRGHAYLDEEQFASVWEATIDEYNTTVHSELGCTPLSMWEHAERSKSFPDEALYLLLEHGGKRTVTHTGIEFNTVRYSANCLQDWVGREVDTFYNPENGASIIAVDPVSMRQIGVIPLRTEAGPRERAFALQYRSDLAARTVRHIPKNLPGNRSLDRGDGIVSVIGQADEAEATPNVLQPTELEGAAAVPFPGMVRVRESERRAASRGAQIQAWKGKDRGRNLDSASSRTEEES